MTFRWGAESAGSEDYIQYLHFFHDDSGAYWTIDQMPLGLRLPTRLWYEGLRSSEVWQFTLPADLQPGRYSIYSGLYRLSDMQRLGVTLADGARSRPTPASRWGPFSSRAEALQARRPARFT